jgi:hypothetical protein
MTKARNSWLLLTYELEGWKHKWELHKTSTQHPAPPVVPVPYGRAVRHCVPFYLLEFVAEQVPAFCLELENREV